MTARILFILVTIQFVLGNLASGFIVLVNCMDWVKRQKITLVDRMLTALAISRIALLWVTLLNFYANMFNTAIYTLKIKIICCIAWSLSNHFSTWLAASLSVIYLLKIANFSNLLFLYLKWRVKCIVVTILLGTLVILVLNLAVATTDEYIWIDEWKENVTRENKWKDFIRLSNMTIFTLQNLTPFIISLTSLVLLIVSLWKHLKKRQFKVSQDPSTKVHIRAMKTLVSFLLVFATHSLTLIIVTWNSNKLQNKRILMLSQIWGIICSSSHSYVLIWGNMKLKHAFFSVLWKAKTWLKNWKPSRH